MQSALLSQTSRRRGRWWFLAVPIVLLLSSGACVSTEDIKTANAYRDLGVSYLNEGNNEAALRELLRAKELNPRDARIRHEVALAFFAKGLTEKAEVEFLAAIRLDPKLSEARLNLGSMYLSQERYQEAVVQLKLVTEDYLYRSPARAWNNLGWSYYRLGRLPEAMGAYQQALRIAPNFCQALHNVALVHTDRKELENAMVFSEKAVQTCPDDPRFRLQLAMTQVALKRIDDATTNLQRVVEKDPVGSVGAQAREALRTVK